MRTVAFIDIDIKDKIYPLTAAYLSGYARLTPELAHAWRFVHHPFLTTAEPEQVERLIDALDAEVYAFSCYVWNMGLISRLVDYIAQRHPTKRVILGGPQVANQAAKYLNDRRGNVVICNGEGEKTFRDYLLALAQTSPELTSVKGLSFLGASGEVVTTPEVERIRNLDEIPSPFQNDLFNTREYLCTGYETTRGCPYKCSYCYWGQLGAKPATFSDTRIHSDIRWIAEKAIRQLTFYDANLGILPRDLDLSRFIANEKRQTGWPKIIGFCMPSNPNKTIVKRVAEMCQIFTEAEFNFVCEIGIQTLSTDALKRIDGRNLVKDNHDSYKWLQNELNANGISPYVDIIGPLPGETLSSFKAGIGRLCEARADGFYFSSLMLINNVALNDKRAEYGLVAEYSKDVGAEGEIVVGTKDVGPEDYAAGLKFIFATTVLYHLRALQVTARYAHEHGLARYEDVFCAFADFVWSHPSFPGYDVLLAMVEDKSVDVGGTFGRLIYQICHTHRDETDRLLGEFVEALPWGNDPIVRACLEADILNRGYVYGDQIKPKMFPFRELTLLEQSEEGFLVDMPAHLVEPLRESLGARAAFAGGRVRINHRRAQPDFDATASTERRMIDCYIMMWHSRTYLPAWEQDVALDRSSRAARTLHVVQ